MMSPMLPVLAHTRRKYVEVLKALPNGSSFTLLAQTGKN
jgi:hypothetical protein